MVPKYFFIRSFIFNLLVFQASFYSWYLLIFLLNIFHFSLFSCVNKEQAVKYKIQQKPSSPKKSILVHQNPLNLAKTGKRRNRTNESVTKTYVFNNPRKTPNPMVNQARDPTRV